MNYHKKYLKYKQKYLSLCIKGGADDVIMYNINDFVSTTNNMIKEYLTKNDYRNIYIILKIFMNNGNILLRNIDNPRFSVLLKITDIVPIYELKDEDKEQYMKDFNMNEEKRLRDEEKRLRDEEKRKASIVKDILSNYYLVTQSRYKKPLEILRPFGIFKELENLYNTKNKSEVDRIKSLFVEIPDVNIIGHSQYGLYFRLVKKEKIDKHKIFDSDKDSFRQQRSFVFDLTIFLEYIKSEFKEVPLFWYANGNLYGSTIHGGVSLMEDNIPKFLEGITDLEEKLYIHECVCRIPIPLSKEYGFLGKINFGILGLS